MDKRTVEIIMMLKGHSKVKPAQTLKESFIRHLSYLYDCPEKYYTDDKLWSVIREAVQDTLSSCSNPGQIKAFMFDYFEARKWNEELEAFISALRLIQVREKGEFINGFTKEIIVDVLKGFYKDRFEVVMTSDAYPDPEDAFAVWDNRNDKYYTDLYSDSPFTFSSKEEAEKGLKEIIEKMSR